MQWLLAGPLHVEGVYDLVREYVGFQGLCVRNKRGCGEWVNDVISLPNGTVACAQGRAVRIWDGGDCEAVLDGHTDLVLCLAFRSQLASGSSDFTVRLWGNKLVLKGHHGAVGSLAFLDDGRLASGSADCTVRIWNGDECVQVLNGHTGCVQALVVLDGFLVSGSTDLTVRIWDRHVTVLRGHHEWITALTVLEDGTLVSGGLDRRIRRWRDGLCVNVINASWCGVVTALASLPGNLIACGFHDALAVFDAVGTVLFHTHSVTVRSLSFRKGQLAVGTKLGGIQIWE